MPEFYLNKNKQQGKAKNYTNHTFLLAAVAAMKTGTLIDIHCH